MERTVRISKSVEEGRSRSPRQKRSNSRTASNDEVVLVCRMAILTIDYHLITPNKHCIYTNGRNIDIGVNSGV